MTITLIILAISAILFVSGKLRSDLVAICSALALVLTGILSPEEALSGFSNPIVIMMGGLFIVGGGIFGTGLAKRIGSGILGMAGTNETRLFILLMLTTAGVGAFVSNTGTVAIMLPIVVSMARGAGLSPSRMLMPLAFAGSMGGMLTLIGTPPNLIVRDALAEAGYQAPGFFSFTPVGIVCIVVGIVVLIPLSKRFLKGNHNSENESNRQNVNRLTQDYRLAENMNVLEITAQSPMCGSTLRQLNINKRYGVTVITVQRSKTQSPSLLQQVEQFTKPDEPLRENDVLYLNGSTDDINLMAEEMKLSPVNENTSRTLDYYHIGMAEVLLPSGSSLVGRTVAETEFRSTYGLTVLGIRRQDTFLLNDIKNRRLHASDLILVQGDWKNIARLDARDGTDWLIIGRPLDQQKQVTLDYKAPLAALIMIAMVAVMAFDFIPVAPVTAVIITAVAMIFTGCVRSVEDAYKAINWESIILFAAMLPMSTALEKTGASSLISSTLVNNLGDFGPFAILATIYCVTSLLTMFISNTVTAVLMAPIAIAAAAAEGVNAVPMLMGVTVAASMCFASPFSTPPNALVMSAGGYKPIDYIRVGLPLQVIMGIVMTLVLPHIFPF
ncbi:MAG: SLC13 family permease [Bacteroidales bacterium]|nr:SLC13 family permease [Bacteroidales bacterium]